MHWRSQHQTSATQPARSGGKGGRRIREPAAPCTAAAQGSSPAAAQGASPAAPPGARGYTRSSSRASLGTCWVFVSKSRQYASPCSLLAGSSTTVSSAAG